MLNLLFRMLLRSHITANVHSVILWIYNPKLHFRYALRFSFVNRCRHSFGGHLIVKKDSYRYTFVAYYLKSLYQSPVECMLIVYHSIHFKLIFLLPKLSSSYQGTTVNRLPTYLPINHQLLLEQFPDDLERNCFFYRAPNDNYLLTCLPTYPPTYLPTYSRYLRVISIV